MAQNLRSVLKIKIDSSVNKLLGLQIHLYHSYWVFSECVGVWVFVL